MKVKFRDRNYAWVITKDHLGEGDEGVIGPRQCTMTASEIKLHPSREKFRIYDDNDILYYSGYMVPCEGSNGFEPLDDFGIPNAGATEIRYKDAKTNEYKSL